MYFGPGERAAFGTAEGGVEAIGTFLEGALLKEREETTQFGGSTILRQTC